MSLVNVLICDSCSNCCVPMEVGMLDVWGVVSSLWVERQLSEGSTMVVHQAGSVCWGVWEQHLGLGVCPPALSCSSVSLGNAFPFSVLHPGYTIASTV